MGSSTEMKVKIGIIALASHTVGALANLASEPDLSAVKLLRYQLPPGPWEVQLTLLECLGTCKGNRSTNRHQRYKLPFELSLFEAAFEGCSLSQWHNTHLSSKIHGILSKYLLFCSLNSEKRSC